MLRITSQNNTDSLIFKLEGSLSGVWVSELLSVWRVGQCRIAGRTLCVDLQNVNYVDKAGEYLLALMHLSGGQLVGSGVVIGELIESIARDWPRALPGQNDASLTGDRRVLLGDSH